MPRIPGPCGVVIFGVTGDLARKKLMPAIYDLANRGLLPPNFALVGFARRDWADEDFGKLVYDAVKTHARTPFRQEVWDRLAEGIRFVQGTFDDEEAFGRLAETLEKLDAERGTGGNHAFYLSIPPKAFQTGVRAAAEVRAGPPAAGPLEPRGDREAVRPRPGQRPRAQRGGQQRVPRGVGVPHRPLPGQGDRPEHPGAALRQRAVRTDLEQQLRRQRPDHHGRGHRPRRSGRLLRRRRCGPRRDPEPPDSAAGADRDGGAGQLQPARTAGREDQGALGDPADAAAGPDHRARSVRRRLAGQREGASACSRRRASPRTPPPRRSPRSRWRSTPAAGPACRSSCAPENAWAAG